MAIDPAVAAKAVEHSTLYLRFATALDLMEAKLVKLVASLPLLLVAILIVLFSMWFGSLVARRMRVLTRIARSNPYMDGLLRGIVRGLIILAGVLVALDLLGATSLVGAVLGSAGVVGLVLGFAFKDIAENYVAGVLLSLRRPFAPGDHVRIDSHEGKVVSLTSRATVLMTMDGNHLQLPNSLVFKSVLLNFSRNPRRRFEFETNVGTQASWHDAMDAGLAALVSVDGVLADPAPNVLIKGLADSGATLQFLAWIDQTRNDLGKVRSEAMRRVRKTLREAGILPPDPVQKVMLLRDAGEQEHAPETSLSRDTSVDHALDAQVGRAREIEDGKDLLDAPP
ncbi:mechanosensitive ion channel family protein [Pseudoluteimonas lycopersici]|uniref:Small-conductance mechanosensitive channel n=1 Tax=Pseudoluteimonas lycopersici TaxID=1324796 RepID=A0A516V3C1_9GAMM|nr:mechanosensitive ion channel family protein [Lysobacter lycopersici]QDQ73016.1 mechanosensitive ion channel family protein [Lysobacter lycopersici]